jgi:acyl-CoA reductase-like NAD-dependent aldehyde dehydrogenase
VLPAWADLIAAESGAIAADLVRETGQPATEAALEVAGRGDLSPWSRGTSSAPC